MFMARLHHSAANGSVAAFPAPKVANEYFAQEKQRGDKDEGGGLDGTTSPEDALALEVGRNAHDYLEECFETEAAVLEREKFDAVPEILKSDFTILGHLGKGNFSDVFDVASNGGGLGDARGRGGRRATPPDSVDAAALARPQTSRPNRPVFALKSLRPEIRSDEEQFMIGAEDLVHETAILANLDHRHIVKLHGRASGQIENAFVLNEGYFILLDRLEETLTDRINGWKEDTKCIPQGPAADQMEVARSVADAMCYLHYKRVIFRDLKPANVGFNSSGVLKLFDFGFAAGLPEEDEANPSGLLFDKCGSPRYMAPEVGLSLGYALPSDVHSFGILLWEIWAMEKPFADIKTSPEFQERVFVECERPPIQAHWPTAVKELMGGCWSARPSDRPTMSDVKVALSLAMGVRKKEAMRKAALPRMTRKLSLLKLPMNRQGK